MDTSKTYSQAIRDRRRFAHISAHRRPPVQLPSEPRVSDTGYEGALAGLGEPVFAKTEHKGATRTLDSSGRVLWDELTRTLGWIPGVTLNHKFEAGWLYLAPGSVKADRNHPKVDTAGRLCLPKGYRYRIGVEAGDDLWLQTGDGTVAVASVATVVRELTNDRPQLRVIEGQKEAANG